MATVAQSTIHKITKQTFIDLGCWLSVNDKYSPAQLERLQNEAQYLALISLANEYWLIGALVAKLQHKNVFDLLPDQLTTYLNEINQVYYKRSIAIQQEVQYCCNLLTSDNIKVVVLKGAASLFNGVADPIASRFMRDVDLLVPESQLEEARALCKSSGYYENNEKFSLTAIEYHHARPLIRDNSQCYIELHRWALIKKCCDVLTTEEIWQNSVNLNVANDISVLQLSPTHQIIHSIAHSELSNNDYKNKHIDLHQLFSFHEICRYYNKQINWTKVEQHFKRVNKEQVLQSYLYNLEKLFGLVVPALNNFNEISNVQFDQCLQRFIKRQGQDSFFSPINAIFSGYRKETILSIYGGQGLFYVWKGRLKHFTRHIKIVIDKYL